MQSGRCRLGAWPEALGSLVDYFVPEERAAFLRHKGNIQAACRCSGIPPAKFAALAAAWAAMLIAH